MFKTENTALLIIDVQEKLLPTIHEADRLVTGICSLIAVAQTISIPIILTEQYPEGIGPTVEPVRKALDKSVPCISKRTFGCMGEPAFVSALQSLSCRQILVAGIEAHVCVFQTTAQLLEAGYETQVVGDAVSSRTRANALIGIERMKRLGADISCVESAAFEMLHTSDRPEFKQVLKIIK